VQSPQRTSQLEDLFAAPSAPFVSKGLSNDDKLEALKRNLGQAYSQSPPPPTFGQTQPASQPDWFGDFMTQAPAVAPKPVQQSGGFGQFDPFSSLDTLGKK